MFIIAKKEGCPNCKLLKDWMAKNNVKVEIRYAEDCMDFCRKYMIRAVPALINEKPGPNSALQYEAIFGYEPIIEFLTIFR